MNKKNHFCKIGEIKIKTRLSVKQAYDIAKKYHMEHNIEGNISEKIEKAMYLDEDNYLTNGVTWMIRSEIRENTFEGMDEFTIMVLDDSGEVYNILDHNGIPISTVKKQLYSDDEFYNLFNENEII